LQIVNWIGSQQQEKGKRHFSATTYQNPHVGLNSVY
jgi:hypothetical protein